MANERITEDIVREHFKSDNFYKQKKVFIEEKQSNLPRIQKLMKIASKGGSGSGYPEFIITFPSLYSEFIIVVECKADTKKHQSPKGDNPKEYAVDGVLLYSSYLSKEFDVLSIAVSGQRKNDLKISHFLQLKNQDEVRKLPAQEILSFENYLQLYLYDEKKEKQSFDKLLSYSKELNNYLRDIDLSESHRPLLISGILIALEDRAFVSSYKSENRASDLANSLFDTIIKVLDQNNITGTKKSNMSQSYGFIKTNSNLTDDSNPQNTILKDLITAIDDKVKSFTKTYEYYDVLGKFYAEFLRYANGDKTLGIVLTPTHITELFVELAGINENSVVLDNCCGTGGFLIASMKKMIKLCNGNKQKERRVYDNGLIGIEANSNMFSLACSNMMIRGDGKANIYYNDCFRIINEVKKNYKPNIGLLNPPYSKKKEDQKELSFILNNLEGLERNSICIAIVPMSCALEDPLKETLLKKHTLEAVMSMPEDLFHDSDSGTVTCTMVIRAHIPHKQSDKKTWFGYWRYDGFVKRKNKGRIDYNNGWESIRNVWISSFKNRETKKGLSLMRMVTARDEWCAEAYMETDYSKINKEDFERGVKEYFIYKMINKNESIEATK